MVDALLRGGAASAAGSCCEAGDCLFTQGGEGRGDCLVSGYRTDGASPLATVLVVPPHHPLGARGGEGGGGKGHAVAVGGAPGRGEGCGAPSAMPSALLPWASVCCAVLRWHWPCHQIRFDSNRIVSYRDLTHVAGGADGLRGDGGEDARGRAAVLVRCAS